MSRRKRRFDYQGPQEEVSTRTSRKIPLKQGQRRRHDVPGRLVEPSDGTYWIAENGQLWRGAPDCDFWPENGSMWEDRVVHTINLGDGRFRTTSTARLVAEAYIKPLCEKAGVPFGRIHFEDGNNTNACLSNLRLGNRKAWKKICEIKKDL